MRNRFAFVTVAALATLTACGEGPSGLPDAPELTPELVITQGAPAPVWMPKVRPLLSNGVGAAPTVGGSVSTPLSVRPNSCDPGQAITVTWNVGGNQDNPATFEVFTHWQYNGTTWTGTVPTTVSVAPRSGGNPDSYPVPMTVVNGSAVNSGTSSFPIVPFNLLTTGPTNRQLSLGPAANVTIFIAFEPCAVTNTPPTLVVPTDFTVEATSSAGALVNYVVTATDLEDEDLTAGVSCTPASGSTFPLGETTVGCTVTDAGGLETTASFKITVVDTTPAYFTSFPSGTITLVAANISGAILDVSSLGLTVEDVGNVSEPSTFACDYVAGTYLAIGSTTTVDCTASDAIGNTSAPSSFDVFVTLNVNATGFLPPLRMEAPYSAHKRGSTIPHKFVPPSYADGTPALDLAAGLHLVMEQISSEPDASVIEANDYGTGSSAWFLDDDGHYHFNVKTGKTSPWNVGQWQTTVSYAGIVLATTELSLVR